MSQYNSLWWCRQIVLRWFLLLCEISPRSHKYFFYKVYGEFLHEKTVNNRNKYCEAGIVLLNKSFETFIFWENQVILCLGIVDIFWREMAPAVIDSYIVDGASVTKAFLNILNTCTFDIMASMARRSRSISHIISLSPKP